MSRPGIAVVGTGKFGANHVRTLAQMGALVAICDSAPGALERFVELPESVVRYTDLGDLLADPTVAGVVIATPAASHAELALKVIAAGKHCLIEKPMTLSSADAERVMQAANKAGKVVLVGHLLLFQPAMREIRRLLDAGAIGTLRHVSCRRTKLGTVRSAENVLWSFAPHDLSVIFWLLGGQIPSRVHGIGHTYRGQRDDSYDLTMEFAQVDGSLVTAAVFVSWMWPLDERSTVLIGDKGMLVYNEQAQTLELKKRRVLADLSVVDEGVDSIEVPKAQFLTLEDEHFIACMQGQATPLPSADNGALVVKVLEMASPYSGSLAG